MMKAIKIVMVVGLVMMTTGEAKEDLENIVKEMNERLALNEAKLIKTQEDLKEMNERLALNEAKLIKNQEDLKKTEEDLKTTQEDLKKNQEDLKKTHADLLELTATNIQLEERLSEDDQSASKDGLAATKDALDATKDALDATKDVLNDTQYGVAATKNPPFFHACGAHSAGLTISSQTISYSSLLYSSTNTEGGNLDVSTGIFSSPYPGSYTVTWSLMAVDDAGDHYVEIHLRKNAQSIDESHHVSYYSGSSGRVRDQGGRTLVLHLDRGDTLDLWCEDCSAEIFDTIFCVSLSTFDIE